MSSADEEPRGRRWRRTLGRVLLGAVLAVLFVVVWLGDVIRLAVRFGPFGWTATTLVVCAVAAAVLVFVKRRP